MERRYICVKKDIVEKTRFQVGDNSRVRPRWKKTKTHDEKWEDNRRQAIRAMARILNCNADTSWYMVTLNFGPELEKLTEGMDRDEILKEVKKQGALYIRRIKRKAEGTFKAVVEPADLNGETGEMVRPHLHVVLCGVSEETIRSAWELGECTDVRRLWDQKDYTPLAVYLIKQTRDIPNMNKYSCTRNMDKPIIEDRVVQGDQTAEIRVQPGSTVLDRTRFQAGTVSQYVRYIRRPPTKKRGGHKLEASEACEQGSSDRREGEGGAGWL